MRHDIEASLPAAVRHGMEPMKTPDDVAAMRRLHALGWGTKRIARELGISRNTVRRHLREGDWVPYGGPEGRSTALDGLGDWLEAAFRQHRGNAAVVRDELRRVHGLEVSLRTVQRAVKPLRQAIEAEARATVRFETPPGRQLQIDFGQVRVVVGGVITRVHLFVATLGYSRRVFAMAFPAENQTAWLMGLEEAFLHFGGVPAEVLFDNTRCLVKRHNVRTGEVAFTDTLLAFCRHWKTTPRACAPYRAQTKGKDERAVAYVKRNGIAGRRFDTLDAINPWLRQWARETADVRVHGTTGDRPIDRFETQEADSLAPLTGLRWDKQRELSRIVATDAFVDVDTNRYSVPWRLIGEPVHVALAHGAVVVRHAGRVVARHAQHRGRHERIVEPRHLAGLVRIPGGGAPAPDEASQPPDASLLRPLAQYEALVGGGF